MTVEGDPATLRAPIERTDLTRRERVLDGAMRLAGVAGWAWHADDGSLEWSPHMYELTGVDPSVEPSTEAFYALVHEDDRDRVIAISDRAAQTGIAEPHEYRIRRADDGSVRWVQTSGEVLRDEAGAIIGFVGAMLDLTERRRVEERAREGQRLESVGRLASGIAHDLNNLLTVILTSAAILEHEESAPAGAQATRNIRDAAERAAMLTGQVLGFAGRQVTRPTVLDLDEVVRSVIDLLAPVTPRTCPSPMCPRPREASSRQTEASSIRC